MNSPERDCAAQVMYLLPSAEAADAFVAVFPSVIAGRTGRHNYTEWDQVLIGEGAAHAAMNPYLMRKTETAGAAIPRTCASAPSRC